MISRNDILYQMPLMAFNTKSRFRVDWFAKCFGWGDPLLEELVRNFFKINNNNCIRLKDLQLLFTSCGRTEGLKFEENYSWEVIATFATKFAFLSTFEGILTLILASDSTGHPTNRWLLWSDPKSQNIKINSMGGKFVWIGILFWTYFIVIEAWNEWFYETQWSPSYPGISSHFL